MSIVICNVQNCPNYDSVWGTSDNNCTKREVVKTCPTFKKVNPNRIKKLIEFARRFRGL